jgi:hypothetical protein
MIGAILTGIATKFSGSAFSTAIGARLYSRFVPDAPTFPYGVVVLPGTEHDWNFSDDFEEVDVQFSIFSNSTSESEITSILTNLLTLYDDCTLTITGYTSVYMQRERIISMGDAENGVRQFTVIYNLLIEK